jgi:integrase
MAKITKRIIDTTPIPKKGYTMIWDSEVPGFGARILPSGVISFILQYRNASGRSRRTTLGRYGVLTPSQAKQLARQNLSDVAAGEDPVDTKQQERQGETFSSLCDLYLERYAIHKRSEKEDRRIIKNELRPAWGGWKLNELQRKHVMKLLDKIVDRGAPIMANRVLALVRKMFNFGLQRGLVENNPCILIPKPGKENRRDRVLNEEEILHFWDNLDKGTMGIHVQVALKLVLATTQRSGEICRAAWSEFDLKERWWTIPGERAKNGMAHRVPLTDLVVELLEELDQSQIWLFPSPRGNQPMAPEALHHAIRRNIRSKNPHGCIDILHFTPHDLRRTAASTMASLGVPRFVIGRILNHAETGVTAVYDRHSYDKEKQQAMATWEQKLCNILNGEKAEVVHLMKA